jgi:hypothetical protein
LARLSSLETLDLRYCGFRRFAPLESLLPTLKYLYLYGCKFDDLPSEISNIERGGVQHGGNVLDKVRAHCRQRRAEASEKIAPTVPLDTPPQIFVSYAWGDISPNWRARAVHAKHWETEFKAMEQDIPHLGQEDLKLYKAMRRWHNEVGDMLAYVNDVLSPHGFDEIVKDDFAALRQMLTMRRMG